MGDLGKDPGLFDDGAGVDEDSQRWSTLLTLSLPDLRGRSVLEIGGEAGFLAAFAEWSGAATVVAVEASLASVQRLRADGPQARDHARPVDLGTAGTFDVILLVSSIPEGTDSEALIDSLIPMLSRRGILVVDTNAFTTRVATGIDDPIGEPPGESLRSFCKDRGYAFRFVWRGDSQPETSARNDVFHISCSAPNAWLLLAPSTSGKTTKSRRLASMPGTAHIRADRVLAEALDHPEALPTSLRGALAGVRPWTLNLAYEAISHGNLEGDLARVLLAKVPDGAEPILDLYLPAEGHERFIAAIDEAGFNPVLMSWPHPVDVDDDAAVSTRVNAFRQHIADGEGTTGP
jgi:SAM-dependent methyltransferase